jgi:hypothetical protein
MKSMMKHGARDARPENPGFCAFLYSVGIVACVTDDIGLVDIRRDAYPFESLWDRLDWLEAEYSRIREAV